MAGIRHAGINRLRAQHTQGWVVPVVFIPLIALEYVFGALILFNRITAQN